MKKILALLIVAALAFSIADAAHAGGFKFAGGYVHLRFGDDYLRAPVTNCSAPAVVYDRVVYTRTVERQCVTMPVTRTVAVTRKVFIPAYTSNILVEDRVVSVPVKDYDRWENITVGTREETVYEKQWTERVVYVPTVQSVATSYAPIALQPSQCSWVRHGGWNHRGGHIQPQWIESRAPSGVISIGGVFRFKDKNGRVRPLNERATTGERATIYGRETAPSNNVGFSANSGASASRLTPKTALPTPSARPIPTPTVKPRGGSNVRITPTPKAETSTPAPRSFIRRASVQANASASEASSSSASAARISRSR